jgi:hypothetical protein
MLHPETNFFIALRAFTNYEKLCVRGILPPNI